MKEEGATSAGPAVVLLSGGLDSVTVLAIARAAGYDAHALSFRYGQRHALELGCAARQAERLGARAHEIVDLSHLGTVSDGVPYLRIEGKGSKVRYIEAAAIALRLITVYLEAAKHDKDLNGPLFRPVKNNATKTLAKPLNPASVYRDIVRHYARQVGLIDAVPGVCVHSLRATAATVAARGRQPRAFRRIASEIQLDAVEYGIGQLLPVRRLVELALLLAVGDERGLHQHGGNVRRLEHDEAGLLHAGLAHFAHAMQGLEHVLGRDHAGGNRRRL